MATQWVLALWAGGLAYEDWRRRRLPNALLLAGIVLGLVHWAAYGSMPLGRSVSIAHGALAAAAGLLLLLPFYRAGWMGAGDVKFCAVIGWLAGLQVQLAVFLVGSVLAGCIALLLLLPACRQHLSGTGLDTRLKMRIPFGVGLAVALVAQAMGAIDPRLFEF